VVRRGRWLRHLPCSPSAKSNHPEQASLEEASASKDNMWYLYITQNKNGSYYTGITDNPKRRLQEHQRGKGGHYTKYNPPIEILHKEEFKKKEEAEKREQQIKRWSRAKKLALTNGDRARLINLSKSRD